MPNTVNIDDLFEAHLNVSWLRPANVVWDTMASWVVRQVPFKNPILDIGSGNGIFSFLTAGGQFGPNFDWFVHIGNGAHADIYNVRPRQQNHHASIVQKPHYRIDVALDQKANLLKQAALLGLYGRTVHQDANDKTPFGPEAFQTIFSNILYWLTEPVRFLKECHRILKPGGQAILCLPDPLFYTYCESYRAKPLGSDYLRFLNGTRADCIRWTVTLPQMKEMARRAGFQLVQHNGYLTRRTLTLWDTEIRATTYPLAKASNSGGPRIRTLIKKEFMNNVRPLLKALLDEERRAKKDHGFHSFVLRKGKS